MVVSSRNSGQNESIKMGNYEVLPLRDQGALLLQDHRTLKATNRIARCKQVDALHN